MLGLRSLQILFATLPVAASAWADTTTPRLEFDGFKARMALEAGHIVRGEFRRAGDFSRPMHMVALNRNIVFLNQSARFEDTWEFDAGLMGVLWWPFTPEAGPPGTRTVRVDPRVSILKARRLFGSSENRSYLEFGYFPYKYNRDSWNLGEYLYRSGTYPGIVSTSDGFQLMSSPLYYAYGAHFHFSGMGGLLSHEVNLFSELVTDPIGDITPAYEIAFNLPILQIGAGVAYNRGLSYRPSEARPKDAANLYIEFKGDSAKGIPYYKGPYLGSPDELQGDPTIPFDTLHRWTHRGIKLAGRAALDLGFLMPEDWRSPEDLRFYTEVALLGWENQPYFYEKRSQRMPIMVGLNLPTLRYLDLLAFQVEHYDAIFNDTYYHSINALPIWKVDDYKTMDLQHYKRSPWKWSLHGRKSLNRLARINAQVASDHLRLRDLLTSPTEYELTLNPKNWYYLVRIEVGI